MRSDVKKAKRCIRYRSRVIYLRDSLYRIYDPRIGRNKHFETIEIAQEAIDQIIEWFDRL
jgi:hypothetical protein